MFSRFKEKLSGFKEALSSKIAEKVSQAEKIAGTANGRANAAQAEGEMQSSQEQAKEKNQTRGENPGVHRSSSCAGLQDGGHSGVPGAVTAAAKPWPPQKLATILAPRERGVNSLSRTQKKLG